MKLSLLPSFNLKPDAEELAYSHPPLYSGKNAKLSFLLNHTFYIAAFLIPLCLMLLMMKHFGYAPFGDGCMFVMDGAYINLPVLNSIIHDLREGTFHFYTLKGTVGGELFSSVAYYLTSPFTLICLFFSQKTAVILLSLFSVLRIALSGPVFLYYLTHRKIGYKGNPYDPMMLVLALGYSLSSFALVQYNDFMFLDHFMLFPLLLLFLEELMVSGKWKKMVFLNAFLLFSNFYLGLILDLFLILYYFFCNTSTVRVMMHRFFKLVLSLLCSCALSAVTVIPGMYRFIANCHTDFTLLNPDNIQGDYFAFFLRHLFYTSPSYQTIGHTGVNLYFGIFALMLAFVYFLGRMFPLKTRIKHAVFLCILVFAFCSEQFSYFFHLLHQNDTSFCCFGFVYLAFLLSLGCNVLPHIRTFSIPRLLTGLLLPAGLTLLCMNFVGKDPNYNSVLYSLALILVYAVFLMLYRIGSIKRDSFFSLVLCVACLELFANAFQLSFCLFKENTVMTDVVITNTAVATPSDDFLRTEYSSALEYSYMHDMNSRYSFNLMLEQPESSFGYMPLRDSFDGVRYIYSDITEEVPRSLNLHQFALLKTTNTHRIYENQCVFPAAFAVPGTPDEKNIDTSTYITEQNSIAKSLGAESSLYTETFPENVYLTLPEESGLSVVDLGNQVFSLENQPDESLSLSTVTTIHFTPEEDGPLYLLLHGRSIYFGDVKAGQEYSYEFSTELSQIYNTVLWIQFFYYNADVHRELSDTLWNNACQISYAGSTRLRIQADVTEDSTIITSLPYDSALTPGKNVSGEISLISYQNKLAIRVPSGSHDFVLTYRYDPLIVGCVLSLLTLFGCCLLSLSSVSGRRLSQVLQPFIRRSVALVDRVTCFVSENRIYFLAFLIPFGCYLTIMCFLACEPFGSFSVFNGDSLSLAFPALHRISDMLREGISAHSWYGGGGYNTSTFIQIGVLDFIFYFVSHENLSVFLTMYVVVMLCLTGPAIVFYLTHRLTGKRAYKKDFRLLIPAMCYSFCNYALLIINNTSWYYALILFPFILVGMHYLMIKKKPRYYIIALGASLLLQYYLTMFICFFLVLHFFTYHFESIRDFIKKGILFAVSSISTGLLSFYSLYYGFFGFTENTYAAKDSVFPKSYLFNGFEFLFNRQSIFSEGFTISWNEGNVNLYYGILPLLLLVLYLLLKKIPLREKLRFLIPYAIFFTALNYSVLNYIFNGLHYQHGVPNRFAFLLVILVCFISYDCIRELDRIPRKKIVLATLGLVVLFAVSYIVTGQNERNTTAFAATLVCLLIYMVLLCRPFRRRFTPRQYRTVLVTVFCLELFVNACYQISEQVGSSYYVTYLDEAIEKVNKNLHMEDSLDHLVVYSPMTDNYAMTSGAKTNTIFSTSLTAQQLNIGEYLGCYATSNAVVSLNTQTPFGYALGNSRYLLMNMISYADNNRDVKYHTPIALYNSTIVYENRRYFPFAYYLPEDVSPLMDRVVSMQDMWNYLTQLTLDTKETMLYKHIIKNCSWVEESKYPDSDYFTLIYENKTEKEKYDYNVHATIPETGSVYMKMDDFQYVGDYKKGEKADFVLDGRSLLYDDETGDAEMYILNDELLTTLCEKINEHPFTVTSFTDDSLSGTIDMPEAGYINFTMPYDSRWHIKLDGKETTAQSLGNGFLTLYAGEGTHEITMEYIDNRRLPVVTVTILPWLGLLGLCLLKDKKRNSR